MQVVQDDDEGHVHSVVLAGALVSKVGQVLAQFLGRPAEEVGECTPVKTHTLRTPTLPGSTQVERPFRRPSGKPVLSAHLLHIIILGAQEMWGAVGVRKAWVLPPRTH